MSKQVVDSIAELNRIVDGMGRVAVAVSGGVDSLTLAYATHLRLGDGAIMYHAVSPAVPPEATDRTRQHAVAFGWRLEIIDAGEFSDPEYLRNPVNRCFHCKMNLYGTIARFTDDIIVSGTNLDDLRDFRPGLLAATAHSVRHPYIESGIDKAMVRLIARHFELKEVSDLPASPCLSSRIETGIPVAAPILGLVHAVEQLVSHSLKARTVRCRIRRDGLVVELDEAALQWVSAESPPALCEQLRDLVSRHGLSLTPRFELYNMGSAFLRN